MSRENIKTLELFSAKKLDTTQAFIHNEDIQKANAIFDSRVTNQMKTLIVFIHTKLMGVDVVLAVPSWQAAYSKVFTSVSSDYAPYTPIAFDVI